LLNGFKQDKKAATQPLQFNAQFIFEKIGNKIKNIFLKNLEDFVVSKFTKCFSSNFHWTAKIVFWHFLNCLAFHGFAANGVWK